MNGPVLTRLCRPSTNLPSFNFDTCSCASAECTRQTSHTLNLCKLKKLYTQNPANPETLCLKPLQA